MVSEKDILRDLKARLRNAKREVTNLENSIAYTEKLIKTEEAAKRKNRQRKKVIEIKEVEP